MHVTHVVLITTTLAKSYQKSLGGQIGRGDGLSEKTESAHMVTCEMNHENCRKALRASDATT